MHPWLYVTKRPTHRPSNPHITLSLSPAGCTACSLVLSTAASLGLSLSVQLRCSASCSTVLCCAVQCIFTAHQPAPGCVVGTRRQAPSAPLCLDGVLNTQTVCCWLRTTVLLDGCLERVPTAGKPKPGSHTPKRVSVMCCHQAFKGVSTSGRPFCTQQAQQRERCSRLNRKRDSAGTTETE